MHAVALILLAVAQTAAVEPPPASPLLPPSHWAVRAAERLEELGLVDRWLPAQRAVPLLAVARALAEGEARAAAERPDALPAAAAWRARFEREWPGAAQGQPEGSSRLLGAAAWAGVQAGGADETGRGPPATGASALRLEAPGTDPLLGGGFAAALSPAFAAGARVEAAPWDASLGSAELVATLGKWAVSVGRGPVGYGPNEVGAVTSSGAALLDRVEVMTTAPVRLPGFLEVLGDWSFDGALARLHEPRHPYGGLLLLAGFQVRPHPRFTISGMRGYMFGGALWDGIAFHDAALGLLGPGNFMGNNVLSGGLRWRLPTDGLLPLTAKLEWGTDDNPGAWFSWPGLVVGLTAPLLPVWNAALGVEVSHFGRGVNWSWFEHYPFTWYAHGQYVGGWATGQTPLGDPLGGNGKALRLVGSADPLGGLVRLWGVAWVAERNIDSNYAPQAAGASVGAKGEVEVRSGRWTASAEGSYERGEGGWSRRAIAVRLGVLY